MHNHKNEMGELTVVGENDIEIPLKELPEHMSVRFKKRTNTSPCNILGEHNDRLEWEVHKKSDHSNRSCRPNHYDGHHKYYLVIRWYVSSVREIVWEATY